VTPAFVPNSEAFQTHTLDVAQEDWLLVRGKAWEVEEARGRTLAVVRVWDGARALWDMTRVARAYGRGEVFVLKAKP